MYTDNTDEAPVTVNRFREAEKFYRAPPKPKRRTQATPETDFSQLIDFTNLAHNTPENLAQIEKVEVTPKLSPHFKPFTEAYTIKAVPGLIFVPNPFTEEQQKYWIKRCMLDYVIGNPTNVSNLKGNTEFWTEWKPEYMTELRWASLGYHFQWTKRIYSEEYKGPFPQDLADLVRDMAAQFGYTMQAEAAIVNFYPHSRCVMGGHLDDAEEDMTKPIVSCSFGNTIIFLIGGRTRDIPPVGMFVRSGDVVIMGGESRYCYHGVPRMIESTCPSFLLDDDSPSWQPCRDYICNARINMNCRQVMYSKM